MKTAIVIPAYNGLEYLRKNLPHVMSLKAGGVIIVDDASTDGTSDFIRHHYPQIHLITNAKNQGFTKSVNTGFRSAAADVVILINQDVTPSPGLVKLTLPYFQSDSRLFAVSFNEGKFGYAVVDFFKGFIRYSNRKSTGSHTSFWASGGSCAIRKSIWDSLGGFDPVFSPGYHEDLDIGWRARAAGYEILWAPELKVDHIRETAFNKAFSGRHLVRIKERNLLICQWKHLHRPQLHTHFWAILIRCLAHPGYVIPVLMAVNHLNHVLSYRKSAKNLIPNDKLFNA